MELGKVIRGKTLGAWKLYSEEQKMQTPIQVLKYINILEEELEVKNSVVLADVSKPFYCKADSIARLDPCEEQCKHCK